MCKKWPKTYRIQLKKKSNKKGASKKRTVILFSIIPFFTHNSHSNIQKKKNGPYKRSWPNQKVNQPSKNIKSPSWAKTKRKNKICPHKRSWSKQKKILISPSKIAPIQNQQQLPNRLFPVELPLLLNKLNPNLLSHYPYKHISSNLRQYPPIYQLQQ